MKKLLSGVKRALSSGPSSEALVHASVTMDHKTHCVFVLRAIAARDYEVEPLSYT
jgi:hypothetical protein